MIRVRNIRDPVSEDDGFRAFIEPYWPDGVSRSRTITDLWFRDLAPDPDLYALFTQNRVAWEDFLPRYFRSLENHGGAITDLLAYSMDGGLTILHGSHDAEHNIGIALRTYLEGKAAGLPGGSSRGFRPGRSLAHE